MFCIISKEKQAGAAKLSFQGSDTQLCKLSLSGQGFFIKKESPGYNSKVLRTPWNWFDYHSLIMFPPCALLFKRIAPFANVVKSDDMSLLKAHFHAFHVSDEKKMSILGLLNLFETIICLTNDRIKTRPAEPV